MILKSFNNKKTRYQDSRFVRNEQVIKTKSFLKEKTVKIFLKKSGKFISLDGVAFDIWKIIKNPISFEDLLKKIQEKYEVSEKELLTDLNFFIKELDRYDLVKITENNQSKTRPKISSK